MDCAVVVPSVSHNAFDNNIFSFHNNNPMSSNVMVRFQQMEGAKSHHHGNDQVPVLKRKRPAKLNLPPVARLLSENVAINSPRDRVEEVDVEGDGFSVYCKKGKTRARLEDRYSATVNNVGGHPKQALFGVFDGHGGAKAAEFAAARLGDNILEHVGRLPELKSDKQIEDKIRDGYLAADEEFLSSNSSGGVCCVTALIQDGHLMVSNVGDCRAVLSKGGLAEALTTDHSPSRDDEKTRIQSKGGYVDCCNGTWRIQGSLAVSRAIGDRHLKQWVIAEPDTISLAIEPDFEFLILASDGLWNKVSNQEAVDLVLPYFRDAESNNKPNLKHASRKLAELSISRGSSDDTSVMLVQLSKFAHKLS